MHPLDLSIFVLYMIAMVGVGFYFLKRNKNADDYYVGGRNIGSWHVGLSVVATDVGGGFSIGLGFTMGLSGSWILFTGLIGAWMAAVLLIPRIAPLALKRKLYTFPQLFELFYNKKVALMAGIISAIGYIGFTSSQLLAGAKLASASFEGLSLNEALMVMGVIAIGYTVVGGLKAVIYTDTIQWIVLMAGLLFIGLPAAYVYLGGCEVISATLQPEMLTLTNISWITIINWAITIIPIWFVGMTLYQRIYACHDKKTAQKAWFIAGLFEWPVMAMMGVGLGVLARVAADQGLFAEFGYGELSGIDPEIGLPLLLRKVLPAGAMGLMMSAYFSAIMSTADSCLMAASGNLLTDVFGKWLFTNKSENLTMKYGQRLTLTIGVLSLLLALYMTDVLELMLYSYAFMVSGLLVPLLAALYYPRGKALSAFIAMITGGLTTLTLLLTNISLPLGLDSNIYGIMISLLSFILIEIFLHNSKTENNVSN